uniref:Uncharacterized mitochondrial protein AtMg00810-like n=1 Tax=Nicotiana tabacum TaxID=4097 RepID=A0A1S3YI85_TOBAC|nr:PREDICTED: uncharacterized mitochondrial protein AtMg00810-like [Nicotiana tabacum]
MDVNNAFLQGDLFEEVYMDLPQGFHKQGEYKSSYDQSLFTKRASNDVVIVLVYVDDILITGSNEELIEETKTTLHNKFKVKDLGHLRYFLGIEVLRSQSEILLNKRKYTLELLVDIGLSGSKPATTPLEMNLKLTTIECDTHMGRFDDEQLKDIVSYQKLVGKLLYLTITRPDISFAVQILSQFMQQPKLSHWNAALRLIRYIKGSSGQGILLKKGSYIRKLEAYCDSDWAACPNTRRAVTRYAIKLGDSLISWKPKKQPNISRNTVEAE